MTSNQFVGLPLGGIPMAAGAVIAFAVPAGLWLVTASMLFLVRGDLRVARDAPALMRSEIVVGLHFLWKNRVLRTPWVEVDPKVGDLAHQPSGWLPGRLRGATARCTTDDRRLRESRQGAVES